MANTVNSCKHGLHGLCWSCIFERRPDLTPPGYQETINQMIKEGKLNDKKQ